jgi:hypothetical protein
VGGADRGKRYLLAVADRTEIAQAIDSKKHSSWIRRQTIDPGTLAGLWVVFYVAVTFAAGQRKLWYDELFTFYMAQLPDLGAVWKAIGEGADLNPMLFQVATRAAVRVFGANEWALRVPAMVGFVVMSGCLFRFVRKRLPSPFALVAMAMPAVSGAMYYATEARAYGMVMGFAGIALVCWQEACSRARTTPWLAGMAAALTGALLSHCWAVLLFIPLGVGELVRDWRRGRIDWGVWCFLVLPVASVVTYLPLVQFSRKVVFDTYLFHPSWRFVLDCYEMLLMPAFWPLLAAASISIWWLLRRREPESAVPAEVSLPAYEMAAAVTLALIPVLSVVMAATMRTAYMNRYGLLGVMGLSVLIANAAHRLGRGAEAFGMAMASLLVLALPVQFGYSVYSRLADEPAPSVMMAPARQQRPVKPNAVDPELPLVASSGLAFLELDHYGGDGIANRLYYLQDQDAAFRYTRSNVFEVVLPVAKKWFPVRGTLASYRLFLQQHPKFLVYGPAHVPLDWLIPKLQDDGAHLELLGTDVGRYGENWLLKVEVPAGLEATSRSSGPRRLSP